MSTRIKPGLAALILLLFLLPLAAKFHLAGRMVDHIAANYYLTDGGNGSLLLQFDRHLYRAGGEAGQALELTPRLPPLDNRTQAGMFSNGDALLRMGGDGQSHLARCQLDSGACEPFPLVLPADQRNFNLRIHPADNGIFLTSGREHKIRHYTGNGELIAEYGEDLRYPKRMELHPEGSLYFANTNRRRIERLSTLPVMRDGKTYLSFGTATGSIDVSSKVTGDLTYTYPLAVQYFAGQWWVINMNNDMSRGRLFRFDPEGRFLGRWDMPAYAKPLDLLVLDNTLLIADASTGVIRPVDARGQALPPRSSPAVSAVALPMHEQYRRLGRIDSLMSLWIALLVVGLLLAALRSARHNRRNTQAGEIRPTFSILNSGDVRMLISNIEVIPNKRVVRHLGLVQGSTVRAKHAGRDIMAGFKNIFGGELAGYTELLQESREEAVQRMSEQAKAIGANAVINVRFSTSAIAAGASEILAYGTAVEVVDT